jgi:hypothetical protein
VVEDNHVVEVQVELVGGVHAVIGDFDGPIAFEPLPQRTGSMWVYSSS